PLLAATSPTTLGCWLDTPHRRCFGGVDSASGMEARSYVLELAPPEPRPEGVAATHHPRTKSPSSLRPVRRTPPDQRADVLRAMSRRTPTVENFAGHRIPACPRGRRGAAPEARVAPDPHAPDRRA